MVSGEMKMNYIILLILIISIISSSYAMAGKIHVPSDGGFEASLDVDDPSGLIAKACPQGIIQLPAAIMTFASWNDPYRNIGKCYISTFAGRFSTQWIKTNIILEREEMAPFPTTPVIVYDSKGRHIDLYGKYIVKISDPISYEAVSGEQVNPVTASIIGKVIGYEGHGPD